MVQIRPRMRRITTSFAYSVLTHEEILDLLWSGEIRPLLLKRYPRLSEDQIKEAQAYAYGGAFIQDLGYYPFGNNDCSNLVHNVRSGDFVRELPKLRANILAFYSDVSASINTKKDQNDWKNVLTELDQLKAAVPVPIVESSLAQ